jgi:uncharacterized protein (TIGR02466 family)
MPVVSESHLQQLFSVPVFTIHWNEAQDVNQSLYQLIQGEKRKAEGIRISNVGGWHSEYSLFEKEEEVVLHFRQMVYTLLSKGLKEIYGDSYQISPIEKWHIEAWANINYKGSLNVSHDHTKDENQWSGIYYLKTGGADPNTTKGRTFLEDRHTTNPGKKTNRIPCLTNGISLLPREASIIPEVGKMVLFPGSMHHRVEEYQGDEERITIAFNMKSPDFAHYYYDVEKPSKGWMWENFKGLMRLQSYVRFRLFNFGK